MNYEIILPSQPKVVREEGNSGVYEIDGLYPGYGHTLGNSLRRIILSSISGAAITHVKIKGVEHEFSAIDGVKEDVITILLALKRLRVKLTSDEPQVITIKAKGESTVTAKDIEVPGQVEILNPELHIATLTNKNAELEIEMNVENGLGFVSKDVLRKDRVEIGSIALDAAFTPIRKANYEVENMRVGDRTDFNRLRLTVETDGTMTPREALEKSISLMISQLKAIVGFKEEETVSESVIDEIKDEQTEKKPESDVELMKTRIDTFGLSSRTTKALSNANIRTLGGLARKRETDLMDVDGLGAKGMQEIKKLLAQYGLSLKQ
ncbi:MAG: DNA-directed RNA polymerase subunit alpha [Patescibacteria group bacterium]|nr:DNA-directed RNA polymerase subunit alpha [Patescibacteria group bacterium]